MSISKRNKLYAEKVDKTKNYSFNEAVSLLKELDNCKFEQSVEAVFSLGVDPKKSDQNVRGATVLPNGTGKSVKVAVFTSEANFEKAKNAGADIVGLDDLAEEVKKGNCDFDVVIATPDAMRVVGQLGQILGPKGLMPNPKLGTVSPDVEKAVKNAKGGQVQYRADKGGIVHCPIGKIKFDENQLRENLVTLIEELKKAKPEGSKGVYMKKLTLSTTMGPGIPLDLSTVNG